MPITNNTGIPLALAVWLVHDEYDYINEPGYISATALMKPLRHLILPKRLPPEARQEDVEAYISRALGHSIHDSMEKAWDKGYQVNLAKLGYPKSVIERVMVNPTDKQLDAMRASGKEPIPVYLEQRMFRRFGDYVIGGKYDAITDGFVNDTKSTSAFSWVFGGRTADYQLQGSIYRWLDAKGYSDPSCETPFRPRITEDIMRINFVFTDWQKMQAKTNPGYPQKRVEQKEIQLLPLEETEAWIREKIRQYEKFKDAPESEIPECSPEELWQSDPVYKYFKDPVKAQTPGSRSTKNFDSLAEAHAFKAEKGQGIVITVPGQPKRCEYCAAFDACTQKDRFL